MAADQEQFSQILTTLLSTDNTVRSQAEVSVNSSRFTVNNFFVRHGVRYDVHYPRYCETCARNVDDS